MLITYLLVLSLLLFNIRRARENHNFKYSVLALFGVMYFGIWPFINFSASIALFDDTIAHVLRLCSLLACVLFSFSPWVTRPVFSYVAIGLFCCSLVVSFGLEKPIKRKILLSSNYFNGDIYLPEFESHVSLAPYRFPSDLYEIQVPDSWLHKKLDGYFDYFISSSKSTQNQTELEFRPSCFDASAIVISELLVPLIASEKVLGAELEKDCSLTTFGYHCLVKSAYTGEQSERLSIDGNEVFERWWYFIASDDKQYGGVMDIVFFQNSQANQREVKSLLVSFSFRDGGDSKCLTPSSWM